MLRELERRLAVIDVSDEVLMAFVDGELDEATSEEVAQAVATDEALRAKVENFRTTRIPVQQAFDPVLRQPIPQHLIDFIRGAAPENGSPSLEPRAARIVPLDARAVRQGGGPRLLPKPLRMAAGLALLVLAGASGWLLHPLLGGGQAWTQSTAGEDGASWARVLQTALEGAPSGASVAIGGPERTEGSVKLVSTFRTHDQRFCRQYAIQLQNSGQFEGLACRTPRAGWLVEHQIRRAAAPEGRQGLRPAAGRARQTLDSTIDELIDGGVLDAEEERKLLENRWAAALRDR
jgi:hypothetical protein